MRIVMIGSGNLATQLGKALWRAGHELVQVYSRTLVHAEALAAEVSALATDRLDAVAGDADMYVISVSDRVLEEVATAVCRQVQHGVVAHTAGSMPMNLLKGKTGRYGVFYPMQTFSKARDISFGHIPVFIEAGDEATEELLRQLAATLTDACYRLSTADRRYLHLAAVWACNFTNHCYHVAEHILSERGIPFAAMLPLIDETARKVHQLSPAEAQTGPAVRYDRNVIDRLSALMADHPAQRELFDRLSEDIHAFAALTDNRCTMTNYDFTTDNG